MAPRTIDTGTTDLLAHIDDGVAVITMNRPERRNAFPAATLAALDDTLAACETTDDGAPTSPWDGFSVDIRRRPVAIRQSFDALHSRTSAARRR